MAMNIWVRYAQFLTVLKELCVIGGFIVKRWINNQIAKYKKKEIAMDTGDGISYAMYFVVIIMGVFIFAFRIFHFDLLVLEETLENRLHVIESAVITSNQGSVIDGKRNDPYERELKRMHIITESVPGNNALMVGTKEYNQVYALGAMYEETFKKEFSLKNDATPADSSIFTKLCGPDGKIISGDVVTIYEPVYDITVTREDNPDYTTETDNKYADQKYKFNIHYNIVSWIQYNLTFNSSNEFQSATKKLLSTTPKLSNGDDCEGATIEATVNVSFKGVRNLFAGIDGGNPKVTGTKADGTDFGVTDTGGKGMFATKENMDASRVAYDVTVKQSVDIVLADKDRRKK